MRLFHRLAGIPSESVRKGVSGGQVVYVDVMGYLDDAFSIERILDCFESYYCSKQSLCNWSATPRFAS